MIREIRQPAVGRRAPTWRQILNPVWLLSDELRPAGWGWLAHAIRNPAINLLGVVLGIAHRERFVWVRRGPGWTFVPVGGWNWGASLAVGGFIPRPFVSWRGKAVEVAIGWKTSGVLSLTVRRANAPNQDERP